MLYTPRGFRQQFMYTIYIMLNWAKNTSEKRMVQKPTYAQRMKCYKCTEQKRTYFKYQKHSFQIQTRKMNMQWCVRI